MKRRTAVNKVSTMQIKLSHEVVAPSLVLTVWASRCSPPNADNYRLHRSSHQQCIIDALNLHLGSLVFWQQKSWDVHLHWKKFNVNLCVHRAAGWTTSVTVL